MTEYFLGRTSCQYFMKSSLICRCSLVNGARTLGHTVWGMPQFSLMGSPTFDRQVDQRSTQRSKSKMKIMIRKMIKSKRKSMIRDHLAARAHHPALNLYLALYPL